MGVISKRSILSEVQEEKDKQNKGKKRKINKIKARRICAEKGLLYNLATRQEKNRELAY